MILVVAIAGHDALTLSSCWNDGILTITAGTAPNALREVLDCRGILDN